MAWLTIYSGKLLKKQQKHTFSFVVACIFCVFFPIGTVLGVFTIIALQEKDVKALYPSTKVQLDRISQLLLQIRARLVVDDHAYHICDHRMVRGRFVR